MNRLTLAAAGVVLAGAVTAHDDHDYQWMNEAPPPAPATEEQCRQLEKRPQEAEESAEIKAMRQACDELRRERYENEM